MARIAGVDLLDHKRVDIALTYIFGVGRANVVKILEDAKVDPSKRVKDLEEENIRLSKQNHQSVLPIPPRHAI